MIDFKQFNMSVVTPHEFFMALEPELFPWEAKIITDFN
jgi:diphthamide synthase subunit DPH2